MPAKTPISTSANFVCACARPTKASIGWTSMTPARGFSSATAARTAAASADGSPLVRTTQRFAAPKPTYPSGMKIASRPSRASEA